MLLSGHIIKPCNAEATQELAENGMNYVEGLIRLCPGNWILPKSFTPYLDKIYSFNFKPTDVFIVTYSKCGTTWMQEIVWTILNNPNLNNPKANLGINNRCPFLEMDALHSSSNIASLGKYSTLMQTFNQLCPGKYPMDGIFLQMAAAGADPRTIKCHLPLSLHHPSILDKCRVIYVARNPKDVCISLLHHNRLMKARPYTGTQDRFVEFFVNNDLIYSPYGLHVSEAWENRSHKNMHFVLYEDMKSDPKKSVEEICKFLEQDLSEDQVSNVVNYTSFAAMKARGNVLDEKETEFMVESVLKKDGGFFRKGEVGSWKEKLTEEQEEKLNKWTKENAANIPFKYT